MKEYKKLTIVAHERLEEALAAFPLEGEMAGALPYGNGHINDTYCAYTQMADGTPRRYIIQRINTDVFKDPAGLMENITGVTAFLRRDIEAHGGDPERETLNVIPTRGGKPYAVDGDGGCWRVYPFIERSAAYEAADDPALFENAAVAFGRFMRRLDGYPAAALHETIPQFHDTRKRFADFRRAVADDAMGRAETVAEEIAFIQAREAETGTLVDMLAVGELPLRVTHNDTKLNNVLFDRDTGEGLCVIDLDTVMPGLCLYDYGDAIRFGASTAAEDERDLFRVSLDLTLFEAFTRGYLRETGGVMTEAEMTMLPMGAKLMTLECGMRFLTDYLAGDTYFRVHRDGHNLDRARAQLKLVADMEDKWTVMHDIVWRCLRAG